MGTNFGMLRHDTYTKYLSRHATSNVTDTLLYGDNKTLLDEKNPHFFGQDNVMPCLKPTKCGRVVLRNVYKETHQRLVPTVGKGTFSTKILDELTFTLSLTLS